METKLHTFAADGNSAKRLWSGGKGMVTAHGAFGGGTLIIQFSDDGGTTWIAYSGSLTAAGYLAFELPSVEIRLNLAGSAGPTLLATLHGIGIRSSMDPLGPSDL